jgi:hypothetical protein
MFYAITMTLYTQIKISKFVFRKRISTTLYNNRLWSKYFNSFISYFFENLQIANIIHPCFHWDIYTIILAKSLSNLGQISCSWKKTLLKLMKTYFHDSICTKKSLSNTITMMYININIKNSLIYFE